MNTRNLLLMILGAFLLGTYYAGRLAWRAHRNLVTLHVRNAPLARVVASMEHQTWERIRYNKKLNAKITLDVDDVPLEQALDLVSAKAGARWQKTFAVYSDAASVPKLETVLAGEQKLEEAGWTNVAPRFSVSSDMNKVMNDLGERMVNEKGGDQNIELKKPAGSFSTTQGGGMRISTSMSNGQMNQWSSERLILENVASQLMGTNLPVEATVETAQSAVNLVHGKLRTYFALSPAPGGMQISRIGGMRQMLKPGDKPVPLPNIGEMIAQERRGARLRELANSPEEQVQRARAGGGGKGMRIQTMDIPDTKTIAN